MINFVSAYLIHMNFCFSSLKQRKNHFIVMDMAYQGFATGDLDRDASALRMFVNEGHQIAYCQSFSKNMGLYGKLEG